MIRLTGVCERDIDLLLVEEFVSSPEFLRWFLCEVGQDNSGRLHEVHHSVSTANGESDIVVEVAYPRGLVGILIENKVDALLQHRQAERYAERAETHRAGSKYAEVLTVIAAPAAYAGDAQAELGFDRRLSYESLLAWFEGNTSLGARAQYKESLVRAAIRRGIEHWTLKPDEAVTRFWMDYWQLAESIAPELQMRRPGNKPSIAGFIYFRPNGLPKGVMLIHKVPYEKVDLQFAGMGRSISELEQRFAVLLEPGMRIVPAAKSAAVSLGVPYMDIAAPLDHDKAKEGLSAARRLYSWYKRAQQQHNKSLESTAGPPAGE